MKKISMVLVVFVLVLPCLFLLNGCSNGDRLTVYGKKFAYSSVNTSYIYGHESQKNDITNQLELGNIDFEKSGLKVSSGEITTFDQLIEKCSYYVDIKYTERFSGKEIVFGSRKEKIAQFDGKTYKLKPYNETKPDDVDYVGNLVCEENKNYHGTYFLKTENGKILYLSPEFIIENEEDAQYLHFYTFTLYLKEEIIEPYNTITSYDLSYRAYFGLIK